MKNKRYKWIILVIAQLLCLTACNKKTDNTQNADNNLSYSKQNIYVQGFEFGVSRIYYDGVDVYINSCVNTENPRWLTFKFNPETRRVEQLPYETDNLISNMDITNKGNYAFLELDKVSGNYYWREVDSDGKIVNELAVDEIAEKNGFRLINNFLCLKDEIIFTSKLGTFVLSYEGEYLQGRAEPGNKWARRGNEGQILICEQNMDTNNFSYDIEEYTGDLFNTKKWILPKIQNGFVCNSNYYSQGVFLRSGDNLYSVNYKTGDMEMIVDSTTNANLSSIIFISPEAFVTLQGGLDQYETTRLCTLWEKKTENSTITLKLASYGVDYHLQSAISEFNEQSNIVKIKLEDYSQYDVSAGSGDGLTMLIAEMNAGKIPDLFDLNTLPVEIFTRKGVLENLRPYFESDKELNYDDYVVSVMNALTQDGDLYSIASGFKVTVLAAASEAAGVNPGWTTEEFCSFAEEQGYERLFTPKMLGSDFLYYVLSFTANDYIDKNSGTCNFQTASFVDMLELASHLPNKDPDEYIDEDIRVLNGEQIITLRATGVPVINYVIWDGLYNGKVTMKGFPSNQGSGVSARLVNRLGISATSNNKDEAWTFLHYLLSKKYQSGVGQSNYIMPVRTDVLDEVIRNDIKECTDEPIKYSILYEGQDIMIFCDPPNNSIYDDVWELIDRIDCIDECDQTIYEIVVEEAQALFAGKKTAEEVAAAIDGRVKIYMSEQYG